MGNSVTGKTCLMGQIWMKLCDKICLWMHRCSRILLMSIITWFWFYMSAFLFFSSLACLSSFVVFCFLIGKPWRVLSSCRNGMAWSLRVPCFLGAEVYPSSVKTICCDASLCCHMMLQVHLSGVSVGWPLAYGWAFAFVIAKGTSLRVWTASCALPICTEDHKRFLKQ